VERNNHWYLVINDLDHQHAKLLQIYNVPDGQGNYISKHELDQYIQDAKIGSTRHYVDMVFYRSGAQNQPFQIVYDQNRGMYLWNHYKRYESIMGSTFTKEQYEHRLLRDIPNDKRKKLQQIFHEHHWHPIMHVKRADGDQYLVADLTGDQPMYWVLNAKTLSTKPVGKVLDPTMFGRAMGWMNE